MVQAQPGSSVGTRNSPLPGEPGSVGTGTREVVESPSPKVFKLDKAMSHLTKS